MFQFSALALFRVTGLQPARLSHSDTCGSNPVCRSPHIFVAYHVLRRRQKPRHPPFALCNFSCCESYLLTFVRRYVLFLLYEKVVPNFLQTIFSDFLPLSFLSQYFNELCNLLQWQPGYRSPFPVSFTLPIYIMKKQACVNSSLVTVAPKRRCSSHTFRYGYLVTT